MDLLITNRWLISTIPPMGCAPAAGTRAKDVQEKGRGIKHDDCDCKRKYALPFLERLKTQDETGGGFVKR